MIIDTTHGDFYYSAATLIATLFLMGISFYYGLRRDYPLSAWMLILFTGLLGLITGGKLACYSSEQWENVMTTLNFPFTGNRTILGGIPGLIAGVAVSKAWLKFNRPVFDSFAIGLPVTIGISRVGCFLAGCCFGSPADLPWSVRYYHSSVAFYSQRMKGLLDFHDEISVHIHPVQLYETIGCLFLAWIIWKTIKKWKTPGSAFIFSLILCALLRFLIEFYRDPASDFFLGQFSSGLKAIQWVILAFTFPLILMLIIREKSGIFFNLISRNGKSPVPRQVILVFFLSGFLFVGRNWLTIKELQTLLLFFLPVIVMTVMTVLKEYKNIRFNKSRYFKQ
jgi:prolipoprotein diacylglyceryltransferase